MYHGPPCSQLQNYILGPYVKTSIRLRTSLLFAFTLVFSKHLSVRWFDLNFLFPPEERVQSTLEQLTKEFGEKRAWVSLLSSDISSLVLSSLSWCCLWRVFTVMTLILWQGMACDVRDAKSIEALADYVKSNVGHADIWVSISLDS